MDEKLFSKLVKGLEEVIAIESGECEPRVVREYEIPDVKAVCRKWQSNDKRKKGKL
ncbi:hypothetical protein [Stenoxybacter acetivorans]|uniref:hypothetical protein n=1 Tax=Stenoxybacter acetivorans TaxID=422441 RepID=UPI0012EB5FF2|nr:hypothetical protein [Stenoxybacter acetivorans]